MSLVCASKEATLSPVVPPFSSPALVRVEIGLWPRRRAVKGQIAVDERGLWLGGALVAPRALVSEAYLVFSGRPGPVVRVLQKGLRSSIDIHVHTMEEGRALLRALGHDGTQATLRVWMTGPKLGQPGVETALKVAFVVTTLALVPVSAAAVLFVPPSMAMPLLFAWMLAFCASIVLMILPGTIAIGGDGLLLSWCGRTRFIPYHDILVVNTVHRPWQPTTPPVGVQLQLALGGALQLYMSDGAETYERIAEAVNAWWGRDGALRTALVQRGPHDARAWLRALRSLGARATVGYRNATVAEDLWRVVEDSAAPPDARAGAAAALGPSLGAEGRVRLRDAARKTVQPKLRVAIESAARDTVEDDSLVEALSALESAEPQRSLR